MAAARCVKHYWELVTRCPHKVTQYPADTKQLCELVQSTWWQVLTSIRLHMIRNPPLYFFGERESTQEKGLNFMLWMCEREGMSTVSVLGAADCRLWVDSFTGCQRHICPPPPSCWVWFSTSTPTQRTKNRLRTHTETGERRKTTAAWDHLVPSHLISSSAGCMLWTVWMGGWVVVGLPMADVSGYCKSLTAHTA